MSLADSNVPTNIASSTIMCHDLISMMMGDWIGGGQDRDVYVFGPKNDLVIKVEPRSHSFQNAMEWEVWCSAKEDSALEKWLAPCVTISPCGRFLLQYRTQPLLHYPEKIPSFLADTKPENFGSHDGRVVAHDYGTTLSKPGSCSMRMVKSKWWNWQDNKRTELKT